MSAAGGIDRAADLGTTARTGFGERELPGLRLMMRDGVELGPATPAVCAIGFFDGVHLGHRTLIAAAREDAAARGVPCVIVTFDPAPSDVLSGPKPFSHLLRADDRLALLSLQGADAVACFSFTPELAAVSWRDFALGVLGSVFSPVSVHVGSNFRFGRGGEGTGASLRELGEERGFGVCEHPLVELGSEVVSSTRTRGLLRGGQVERAGELLGRAHLVRGRVSHGRGEGTSFGFPTANVDVDPLDCMPAEGVYAGWVARGASAWPAAINVGAPRTFTDELRPSFLEANLIGFEGDLYGCDVAVAFAAWLRAPRHFSSTDELERVVLSNIGWVQTHLGTGGQTLGADGVFGLRACDVSVREEG